MRRAALLYAALMILLAWPLSVHPATTVLSDAPDTNLYLWTLAWDTHAFIHQPLSIFDANIYYPEHDTLAYSENLIGSAFLAAPVIWLTGNLVLAMNLVALLSAVLCGLGTYLLARKVGIGEYGALVAGIIFAFSPPRFLRLDQLHLATIQWLPFGLVYLHAYLDDGRPRHLRLFLAFFTLQALTSGHGTVFLLIASAIVVAYHAAFVGPLQLMQRIRDVGTAGALLLAPALLVMLPYHKAQVDAGLRRTLENWTVTPESFLASPSHVHAWLLGLLHATHVNDAAQTYLFPGFVAIVLAVVGLGAARLPSVGRALEKAAASRRHIAVMYALVILVSVLMAVGPPFSLWPLVYWLPGLNFVRAPSRFMMLALLGVAVLAGMGFERLTAKLEGRRALLAAIVGALLVAEYATMPFGLTEKRIEIPGIDRWLAAAPGVGAIAEVPLIDARHLQASEMRHTTYMLFSTAHWRKTVEGYSGIRPALHERLYAELLNFPDATSLGSLAGIGVTHIVVHTDLYDPAEWPAVDARLRGFTSSLRLERSEGEGRIYSLHRP